MGTTKRLSETALEAEPLFDALITQGFEFEFPQVVSILEGMNIQASPLGEAGNVREEAFKISSRISLGVPPSDVHHVKVLPSGEIQVSVNFLGIAGVYGPLAPPFVELAMERARSRDTSIHEFLDLFNHRLVSLWYRIFRKASPGGSHQLPQHSPIGKTLFDIGGQWSAAQRHSKRLLPYASDLWRRPRSAVGLERFIGIYFNIQMRVQQFMGKWVRADESLQSRIGSSQGVWNVLGRDSVLGNKFWNREEGIEIILGPMTWPHFLNLLPGESGYAALEEMVHYYVGDLLQVRYQMQLAPKSLQFEALGSPLLRLGYTSWLQAPEAAMAHMQTQQVMVSSGVQ